MMQNPTETGTGSKRVKSRRSWTRTPPPEHTPSTEEWVQIARKMLIEEGIVEVKIDRLAKAAGVTRGGFYWRFKSREDLLTALLDDWRTCNTEPLLRAIHSAGSPLDRLHRLADTYINERDFSSSYDNAVRTWANLSQPVAELVSKMDIIRIEALKTLFLDAGYDDEEALVRARITYFHQVGYYTTRINEPIERREVLSNVYMRVLIGSI
jgi:AcrR family transcriptional regulator